LWNRWVLKNENKQSECPFNLALYRLRFRESSPEGIRVTIEERICEEFVKEMSFKSGVKGP